jgi:TonB family protein
VQKSFAWLLALSLLTAPAEAQERFHFNPEVYRAWADAANGQPCETQLEGFLAGSPLRHAYPVEAVQSRTSGEVLLTFDTRYADGALLIENARVFRSDPSSVFDEAALAAAREFVFPPEMRNCQGIRANIWYKVVSDNPGGTLRGFVSASTATPPLRRETAEALLNGRLRDHCQVESPINAAELGGAIVRLYPEAALQRERQGLAVVQFSITPEGAVSNPVALEDFPSGWGFGSAAAQAMSMARYPRRAEACENAVVTVRFVVPN